MNTSLIKQDLPIKIDTNNKSLIFAYKKCKSKDARFKFVTIVLNHLYDDFKKVLALANPDGSDFHWILKFLEKCDYRWRIFARKVNALKFEKINYYDFQELIKEKSIQLWETWKTVD